MTVRQFRRAGRARGPAALILATSCAAVQAQVATGSGGGGIRVTTGLSASATATNNVNLSSNDPQSSLILTVTPTIQVSGQSGRVRGSLSYALGASLYAGGDQSSTFYNYLSANANVEAVPSRVFIDASASISRQLISPFGTQSASPVFDNANSTQVATFSVSPYVTGQIAGEVNYTGRADYSVTSSGTSLAPGSTTWGGILHFDGATRLSHLDWAANFTYRQFNYTDGRNTFDQLSWLALNYGGFYDLVISARANRETSNITSFDTETHYGYGGGVRWTPSPRTDFIAQYDTRVFGSSHLYAFNYRTARTAWSISSTQGLSTGQGTGGTGIYGNTPAAQTTAFELFYSLFASIQPDPALRTQLVNDFLKANGINPSATLQPNYLPSQTTEQLSFNASVAWTGLRDAFVFSANRTRSTNLGPLSNPSNDFFNAQPVTWLGFTLSWSHRLTPRDSLSVGVTQQQNSSDSADTTFRSANAAWTSQLAERISASLSGNYSVQRGSSAYNQASVTASMNITF